MLNLVVFDRHGTERMETLPVAELLLEISGLLALTYFLGGLIERWAIPIILGALFVAMGAHYTPFGARLLSDDVYPTFTLLADLGVLFLLFYIGLQIDLKDIRRQGSDILLCTALNTTVPFLLGFAVMLWFGYDWVLAIVIGMTRMPTAEAVIVPILDEYQMIRTRVGQFIIGVGTLDDVIEVLLVGIVSVWIAGRAGLGQVHVEAELVRTLIAIAFFTVLVWLCYRWLLPRLAHWVTPRARNLMLLSVVILFSFGGFTEWSALGMVLGAILAGVVMRPSFAMLGEVGEQLHGTLRSISYGFLGLIFFFWVGLSIDPLGVVQSPLLTVLLYLAGTVGKLLGVFAMVPMRRMSVREAWVIGIGLDARLTTEIIVAKLLFDAQIIDDRLFSALVAAASLTAITVPLAFTVFVRRWRPALVGKAMTAGSGDSR